MAANQEKNRVSETPKAQERTLLQRIEKALEDSMITPEEARDIKARMLNEKNQINNYTYSEWYNLHKDVRRKFQEAIGTKGDAVLGGKTKAKLIERAADTGEIPWVSITAFAWEDTQKLHAELDGALDTEHRMVKTVDITEKLVESKNSATTSMEKLQLLSDLNANGNLDAEQADFVKEKSLKNSLSLASDKGAKIDEVYQRITGEAPDWNNRAATQARFHASLRTSIDIIRQLTNGNAGLNALLTGNLAAFVSLVKERVAANGGNPLHIQTQDPFTSDSLTHNVAGATATLLVGLATSGLITVGHEKHDMQADDFMKQIQSEAEGNLADQAKTFLVWLKEAFMGRRLSVTLGKELVAEYKKNIFDFSREIMGLTKETQPKDIKNSEVRSAFITAQKTLDAAGIPKKEQDIALVQKTLIQSYIIGEGFKRQGSSWQMNIGLLMPIGGNRDAITAHIQKTKASEHNAIESKATRKTIDKASYETAGIKMEKTSEGKWICIVPKMLQLQNDLEAFPVSLIEPSAENEASYLLTFDSAQKLSLTFNGEEYIATFAASKKPGVAQIKQWENAPTLRAGNEKISKNVPDLLYYIGHSADPELKKLVTLLSRQDYVAATTHLEKMQKGKYKTMATTLLNHKESMLSWTTYTWGSNVSRGNKEFTQADVDSSVRTKPIISAERRLAKVQGITQALPESEFRHAKGEKYSPAHIASIIPGQDMTVSVLSTPSVDGKKGLHRIDTLDASIAVSKLVMITKDAYKREIVDATARNTSSDRGIHLQLKQLNDMLAKNKMQSVSLEQYKNFLVTGKTEALWVNIAIEKEAKFFEARAMVRDDVAGNVCINRTLGIAYPRFRFPEGELPRVVVPEIEVGASIPLAQAKVNIMQTAAGLNTAGAVRQFTDQPSQPPTSTTTPGFTPSTTPAPPVAPPVAPPIF